mgnify:CR=1 FL=1
MIGGKEEFDLSGAVQISGHLYKYVDDILRKVFHEEGNKGDVHQFALAVGIASDNRLPRSQFKADLEDVASHPGNQLATYSNIEAIVSLISLQGSIGESTPNEVISEYINGGLVYLKGISFEEQDKDAMASFIEDFPHLAEEGES